MNADLKTLIEKAEQGDVEAAVKAGDCYNKGLLTEPDDEKAHKYYLMAAKKGHAKAELMAGIDFYYGIGTKVDAGLGIEYIQSAADKDVAHAQYILALIYGAGVDRAYLKGNKEIYYLEKAAKLGHPDAQIKLGDAYYLGEGVKAELSKAIFWLCCAYLHGKNYEESSKKAEEKIAFLIQNGMPGGWDRIKKVSAQIKREYPQYMQLNKETSSKVVNDNSDEKANTTSSGSNKANNDKMRIRERKRDCTVIVILGIVILLIYGLKILFN